MGAAAWRAGVVAAVIAVGVAVVRPEARIFAGAFAALWLGAPVLAAWLSRPTPEEVPELSLRDRALLRRTARKTWRFFETFITEADHWLPPDNYQDDPAPLVARRTSPTNMGLALLGNVAAVDLGYLGVVDMVDRCERTLGTRAALDR